MKTVKKVSFCCIPIYERLRDDFSMEQRIFGFSVRRKYLDNSGWNKCLFGWRYDHKPTDSKFKFAPPHLNPIKNKKLRENDVKELLVVLPPGIGDNIIIRNFLQALLQSDKYKNFRLTVLGRSIYKPFAEFLDSEIIEKYLIVDKISSNSTTLWKQLEQAKRSLIQQGLRNYYHTIIYASQLFNGVKAWEIETHLLNGVASEERIGFCPIQMECTTDIYLHNTKTVLYYDDTRKQSVFDIGRYFFEQVIEESLSFPSPYIDNKYTATQNQHNRYIVLSPCAASAKQEWHSRNWRELLVQLKRNAVYDVFIICSQNQKDYCKRIQDELLNEGIRAEVKAGLGVKDLLTLLKGAEYYITIDSGIFHVAVSLGSVKTVCISSGHNYFRFIKYAEHMPNVRVVFPRGWREWFLEQNKNASYYYPQKAFKFINAVRVNDVVDAINNFSHD